MNRLATNIQRLFGAESVPIRAQYKGVILFTPGTPEYNAYAAQLAPYCEPYTYLGSAPQTSNGFIAEFNLLSPTDKVSVMSNYEYDWLAIHEAEAFNPAWTGKAQFIAEAAIHGVAVPANLAQSKLLAENCWKRINTHAATNGCSNLLHYASPFGVSFSDPSGVPRSNIFTSAPGGDSTWFDGSIYYEPIRTIYDNLIATGQRSSLVRAQSNASMHGVGAYCFIPNSDYSLPLLALANPGPQRKNQAGVVQSPPWEPTTLRYAVRQNSKRILGEYRRAMLQWEGSAVIASSDVAKKIAMITLIGDVTWLYGSFIYWHHLGGPRMKDPKRTAEDEIASLFDAGGTDCKLVGKPDEIWLWGGDEYYWILVPGLQSAVLGSPDNTITHMTRCGIEKAFFKRPLIAGGEPIGTLVYATQDAWYAANCMPDSRWWDGGPNDPWWTVAGGNQLPAPCVLDQTSLLAPYLNWNASIYRADVKLALRHWLTVNNINTIREYRLALNRIGR